jgi:hypothetical protein
MSFSYNVNPVIRTVDATSEQNIEDAIDTLANLTLIQGQAVTLSGSLTVESASLINQDVTSDATPTFASLRAASIGNGAAHIAISSAGEVTNTSQPAFSAQAANQNNVTGDGTVYTVVFGTEIFDQNADFDGTSTFTAPVAGKYWIGHQLLLTNVSDATRIDVNVISSNRTYYFQYGGTQIADANSGVQISDSMLIDMDASDTVYITLTAKNGTKIVDVNSASRFYGYLVA